MLLLAAREDREGLGAIVTANGVAVGEIRQTGEGDYEIVSDELSMIKGLRGASPRDVWNHLLGEVRAGHIHEVTIEPFEDYDPSNQ